MYFVSEQTQRRLSTLLLVGFLILAGFGLFTCAVSVNMGGSMVDCPLMSGATALCSLDALAHITVLEESLSAFATHSGYGIMLLLLFVVLLVAAAWLQDIFEPPRTLAYVRLDRAHDKRLSPPLLQQLFSAGILNSKAY